LVPWQLLFKIKKYSDVLVTIIIISNKDRSRKNRVVELRKKRFDYITISKMSKLYKDSDLGI